MRRLLVIALRWLLRLLEPAPIVVSVNTPPPEPPDEDACRYRASLHVDDAPFAVVFDTDTGGHWTLGFDRATWRLRDWPEQVPDSMRESVEDAITLALAHREGIRA